MPDLLLFLVVRVIHECLIVESILDFDRDLFKQSVHSDEYICSKLVGAIVVRPDAYL